MLKKLKQLIIKAKGSKFWLFVLNRLLWIGIPFNKPHKLRIIDISENHIKTFSPFRRKNLNHIKGIHACCIATVSEFSSGTMLISKLDPGKYRIIMANLNATYHYQAKKDLTAITKLDDETLNNDIIEPLTKEEKIIKVLKTEVYDADNNHVATVETSWQIKSWSSVKTKV